MSANIFQATEITQMRQLRPGDHLAVSASISKAVELYHHGIYLGAEIGVADFSGEDKNSAKVGIHDILEFTDNWNKKVIRIEYGENDCLSTEQTISHANRLIENPLLWKSYHILINNCEHFATYCKTGRSISLQSIDFMRKCILNPFEVVTYFKMSKSAKVSAIGSVSIGGSYAGLSLAGSMFVTNSRKSTKQQTE